MHGQSAEKLLEAAKLLDQALAISYDELTARRLLEVYTLLQRTGDASRILEAMAKADTQGKNYAVPLMQAQVQIHDYHDYMKANQLIHEALRMDPHNQVVISLEKTIGIRIGEFPQELPTDMQIDERTLPILLDKVRNWRTTRRRTRPPTCWT